MNVLCICMSTWYMTHIIKNIYMLAMVNDNDTGYEYTDVYGYIYTGSG